MARLTLFLGVALLTLIQTVACIGDDSCIRRSDCPGGAECIQGSCRVPVAGAAGMNGGDSDARTGGAGGVGADSPADGTDPGGSPAGGASDGMSGGAEGTENDPPSGAPGAPGSQAGSAGSNG